MQSVAHVYRLAYVGSRSVDWKLLTERIYKLGVVNNSQETQATRPNDGVSRENRVEGSDRPGPNG